MVIDKKIIKIILRKTSLLFTNMYVSKLFSNGVREIKDNFFIGL